MEKKSILVVDDAPANIDLIANILRDQYKIKAATNGDKALKSATKSPPDLILLDVMLGDENGMDRNVRVKAFRASGTSARKAGSLGMINPPRASTRAPRRILPTA